MKPPLPFLMLLVVSQAISGQEVKLREEAEHLLERAPYGDYHLLNVWTQKQVAVVGSRHLLPPELVNVMRITPIWLLYFDGEDVIRTISEREVNGSAARSIMFETVKGKRTDNNGQDQLLLRGRAYHQNHADDDAAGGF
jgi:hypothetical protein